MGYFLEQFLTDHGLMVTGVSGGTPMAVGGSIANVAAELIRPSDPNAYVALDALSDSTSTPTVVLAFANAMRVTGGTAYLVKARLMTDQKTCTARFRLHLYRSAPTAINDNSPFTILYANNAIRIGSITFPALTTEDPTNSTAAYAICVPGDGSNLPLEASSVTTTVYGLLETLDGFTPASGQKFYVGLSFDQN